MKRLDLLAGWRGTLLVAATYVYFLIFAQFGFLERLTQAGLAEQALRPVMGAMAFGGILASLLAARHSAQTAVWRLRAALFGCAAASFFTLLPLNFPAFLAVAVLIGGALGELTVTLVSNLRLWTGGRAPLLSVGLGTGIGYFICNIPALFNASAAAIGITATIACLAALAVSSPAGAQSDETATVAASEPLPFPLILLWFTALVWLDSAAFFIIQNSPALKLGAWHGSAHLWRTGAVHLIAALLSVLVILRRGTATTLLLAFSCLAGSCLLLLNPTQSLAAAILYPAGVSLYSVALVAYPSLLMPGASAIQRSRRAGWIYAVAGWIGSAMGIGMAQHLHRIPVWFVAVTGALFVLPLLWRFRRAYWREIVAVILVAAAAWALQQVFLRRAISTPPPAASLLTPVQRGRQVYISEGCINCHSQYVRPHSRDVEMWGPAGNVEGIRRENPPLIGNRRQGPDLTNVGSRRSPLWLRIHMMDPRAVSYGSIMPSYAYLFRDQRGSDLVAFLASLRSPGSASHLQHEIETWRPNPTAVAAASHIDGAKLFREDCATCHEPGGYVRTHWGADFHPLPPNLAEASVPGLPPNASPAERRLRLERIIKFGMPGTNMPGHEYLPDAQIAAIARYVDGLRR